MREAIDSGKHAECHNRQLGTCLVLKSGKRIWGWNGPPVIMDPCKKCRKSEHGFKDAQKCPAVHAERRPILVAAYYGYEVRGSTLYCACGIPCKDCMVELAIAGVERLVVLKNTNYDELSLEVLKYWVASGRKFEVMVM